MGGQWVNFHEILKNSQRGIDNLQMLKYNIDSTLTGDNSMTKVNLTSLIVTEYVPDYMAMQEIHFEYDFINHRYKVDYGEWKPMTQEKELKVKAQYNIT